mmetsp:Transcript_3836/g.6554  ORF Transcript_3836/g.6554 Transcript_3836/m.6554 type:complete len:94 (+) Transcript_3836:11-292(+)
MASRKRTPEVESLQLLSTQVVATNIDKFTSLGLLPLSVVAQILNSVLQNGLLTPHSFKLFEDTGYPEIKDVFDKLEVNANGKLPVLPYRCGWK